MKKTLTNTAILALLITATQISGVNGASRSNTSLLDNDDECFDKVARLTAGELTGHRAAKSMAKSEESFMIQPILAEKVQVMHSSHAKKEVEEMLGRAEHGSELKAAKGGAASKSKKAVSKVDAWTESNFHLGKEHVPAPVIATCKALNNPAYTWENWEDLAQEFQKARAALNSGVKSILHGDVLAGSCFEDKPTACGNSLPAYDSEATKKYMKSIFDKIGGDCGRCDSVFSGLLALADAANAGGTQKELASVLQPLLRNKKYELVTNDKTMAAKYRKSSRVAILGAPVNVAKVSFETSDKEERIVAVRQINSGVRSFVVLDPTNPDVVEDKDMDIFSGKNSEPDSTGFVDFMQSQEKRGKYTITKKPEHGALTLNASTGKYTYRPYCTGQDDFQITFTFDTASGKKESMPVSKFVVTEERGLWSAVAHTIKLHPLYPFQYAAHKVGGIAKGTEGLVNKILSGWGSVAERHDDE